MWTERGKGAGARMVNRERSIKKLFLRGDSVVIVLLDPK